jgi:hypothetical protein
MMKNKIYVPNHQPDINQQELISTHVTPSAPAWQAVQFRQSVQQQPLGHKGHALLSQGWLFHGV